MLDEGIDWTLFARKAIDHGLAGLAGHTLTRVAPDMVPDEIRDAFRELVDQTRQRNRALFGELAGAIEALANNGVEAIPFNGPVLAIQAYGDPGLCVVGDPDFLIRDPDIAPTMTTLRGLGYERKKQLTVAQLDLIQRLQGEEILFKKARGIGVAFHTRLTPMNMALDIDYAGLWRRAQRTTLNGRTMLTLAPEDNLLILAIHGGKEMWWHMSCACDIAGLIGSHPNLDWVAILSHARAQGCLRIVLLATSLARKYFNATVPDAVAAAERDDRMIELMAQHIMARWLAEEPARPPSNKRLWMDRLRLHDGVVRRARFVARTLFLPDPHHVARIALPRRFTCLFAYVPIKIVQDVAMLPLLRAYRKLLAQTERLQGALTSRNFFLAVLPASAEMRLRLKRHQEARADANRALAADPTNVVAWDDLGNALSGLKRYEEAIACYDKALAIVPDNTGIWKDRDAAIRASTKKAALSGIEEEPTLDPQDANAWVRRAGFLLASQRFGEAAAASDRALVINPKHLVAMRIGIRSRVTVCDWHRREDDKRRITECLRAGLNIITPFNHRTLCDSEAESLIIARLVAKGFPRPAKPLWRGETYRHDRIRVAYLSAEFHDHPMTSVMAGVYEHHDRTRFETTAISLGPDDVGKMRRRIKAAFDHFIDAQAMSDSEVATMLREAEVDIAIDLNGYAGSGRMEILAHRPSPVQVNFLAYSGTTGVPFFDYIIADRMVIPDENRIYYSERVVYLPDTYMPNDRNRPISENTPSRTEAGLPETGFVFACHNAEHKISPEIFGVWMRLLRSVEGSVLWLKSPLPSAMGNLWREARARGVAPERLVFAPRVPQAEDHLARLRLADLFLDTLPYNAHATACDALWAGLPVLTCPGNAFPARVAASLLYAIGLPELVTSSLAEYEELALALARDPERLAAIKAKLMRNRDTEPLFNTARFTRDLETAYTMMWKRTQCGESPESFSVASAPSSTGIWDA
jgi:predicted O-linked N-acetylglucosamine transferase (SPINDLY family)